MRYPETRLQVWWDGEASTVSLIYPDMRPVPVTLTKAGSSTLTGRSRKLCLGTSIQQERRHSAVFSSHGLEHPRKSWRSFVHP